MSTGAEGAVEQGAFTAGQPLTHRGAGGGVGGGSGAHHDAVGEEEGSGPSTLQWVDSSPAKVSGGGGGGGGGGAGVAGASGSLGDGGAAGIGSGLGGAEGEKYESTAGGGGATPDLKQRALRMVITVRAGAEAAWRGLRGWRDFADTSKFSVPTKMEAFTRARVNLVYYRSNYTILMGLIAVWTILSNLVFTIAMCIVAAVWRLYYELSGRGTVDVTLPGGRAVSPIEAYLALSALTLLSFYVLGGSGTVFWLVTTCIIVIFGHATMHEQPCTAAELALDDLARPDFDRFDWV